MRARVCVYVCVCMCVCVVGGADSHGGVARWRIVGLFRMNIALRILVSVCQYSVGTKRLSVYVNFEQPEKKLWVKDCRHTR